MDIQTAEKARLDYFLISPGVSTLTNTCNICSRYRSDHAPITLKLNIDPHIQGRGYWKLNSNLLINDELVKKVKDEILLIKQTYALIPYNPDYIISCPMSETEFMINDSLLWETILAQLRGTIIRFSARQNRNTNNLEKILSQELDTLERNYNKNPSDESLAKKIDEKT